MMLIVMTCVLISAFILGLTLLPMEGLAPYCRSIIRYLCRWVHGRTVTFGLFGLGRYFCGSFFGLVAVCFLPSTFKAGVINTDAMLLGLAVGLVINNLLVRIGNNYRDVEIFFTVEKKPSRCVLAEPLAYGSLFFKL